MISRAQILRLAESQQMSRLLQRVLANGRPCSPAVRRRLLSPAVQTTAALALAVQRYLELSYDSRSEEGDRLVSRLLVCQHEDGLFGSADGSDDDRIAATAMALRALIDYLAADPINDRSDDNVQAGGRFTAQPTVRFSAALALRRAAQALRENRIIESRMGGDPVTAQIIDWQLGAAVREPDTPVELLLEQLTESGAATTPGMNQQTSPESLAEAA